MGGHPGCKGGVQIVASEWNRGKSRARDSERLLSYRKEQQAESFQNHLEFCPDSVTSLPVTLISSPPFYVFSVLTREL